MFVILRMIIVRDRALEVSHDWKIFQTHQPIEMDETGMNQNAEQPIDESQ